MITKEKAAGFNRYTKLIPGHTDIVTPSCCLFLEGFEDRRYFV